MAIHPEPRVLTPEQEEQFELQVAAHRAAFGRLAWRLTGNPDDAEDLLQETLLDAYRGFRNFRPNTHFYSWVARIMTNNQLDRARRKSHPTVSLDQPVDESAPVALELPDHTTNPEQLLLHAHLDQPYQSALDALQPAHRATVELCDLEGATYEEAARAEDCPVGTIRSRLHRAHQAIRNFLTRLEPTERPALPTPAVAHSRRAFLRMGTAAAAGAAFSSLESVEEALASPRPIRVLVWSEGTAPRSVYPHDINGAIAEGLRGEPGLEVRTASLQDPDQGLSDAMLQQTDVLIWWGNHKQAEVAEERVNAILRRVRDEGMGFIATHSANRSKPLTALLGAPCQWNGGVVENAEALELTVTAPRHPIARGLNRFQLVTAEHYAGPLETRKPDVVIFDAPSPATGERTWMGMVWKIGQGRVFYFQPGHESHPVYFQDAVKQVFRNAVHWCAHR